MQMKKFDKKVRNELKKMGISGGYLGEKFLALALQLLDEDSTRLCCVSKLLYEDIAKSYRTSASCVERNFRTLTSAIWNKGNRKHLEKIAGCHLECRPSNIEFLDMMSVYLSGPDIS